MDRLIEFEINISPFR